MDKGMVVFLSGRGWAQAKIARRFNVARSSVHRFLKFVGKPKDIRCELCNSPIEKKQYIKIAGADPFVVCDDCKKQFEKVSSV